MKKTLVIFVATILCILFATSGVSASSNVDNEKYIPKVITTDNGYKMMFDSELARTARRMASDSYGIAIDSNVQDISKTFQAEGFEDIKQSHLFDEPFMGAFSNNFLVGVKTFEVDGVEKHVLAIAFRGTQVKDGFDYADLFTDASVLGLNGFHSGFYAAALKAYDTLYDMEFQSLKNEDGSSMTFSDYLTHSGVVGSDYSILVTGHSLGGAVANIFAGDIISQFGKSNVMCYTFASPIVCSPTKAKEYDAYNIFNIINTNDIVPNVGYNLFAGVRLGTDLNVSVTDSEESAHSLSVTYEKATNQIISKMDSLYPYIHRTRITTVTNDVETIKDEIHIHTDCELEKRRFSQYLGNSDLFIYKNVNINTEIIVGGNFEINRQKTVINADAQIKGNLTMGSAAELDIGVARIEVGGNYSGLHLNMNNDSGHIIVNGNCDNSWVYSSLTAGTFEIKGDLVLSHSYKASGTHKMILSGTTGQTVDLNNFSSEYRGILNNLEITNTSEEGVRFEGEVYVCGELFSESFSKIINGDNICLSKTATVRGTWNGDLSASAWTANKPTVVNGNLKIIYINNNDNSTIIDANIRVNGNFEVDSVNMPLEIGSAKLEIGGDFHSGLLKMTNSDGYIVVKGNCDFSKSAFASKWEAGTFEIKGDITNGVYYRANGTHKTIISGDKKQTIDLNYSFFNILEIQNTSNEGVEFVNEINVLTNILQPIGTKLVNNNYVKLQNKTAFVDYGELNSQINIYNNNAENVIPTWLDYEKHCKFVLDGDKAFTLNETITNTSFDCDLYFSNDYNKSSAIVIVAFYGGDNRFVQMASKPVDVKAGKIDVSIDYESKPYSKYKIMVWENFDNIKPLMKVK